MNEEKLRLLIVDDSVAMRRILHDLLSEEPDFEISTAPSGRVALAKITLFKPHLVTLDVEMPEMNGLEALTTIRQMDPHLPVVMVSSLTEKGANIALDALALGANDYVAKPSKITDPKVAMAELKAELVEKIRGLCRRLPQTTPVSAPPLSGSKAVARSLPRPAETKATTARVEVVVIGISTGGPNALMAMLPELSADLSVPILIVQHMPATFTKLFASRLDAKSAIHIHEAQGGEILEPGHAWIAPGDYHLTLLQGGSGIYTALNQEAPENSCRPSADVLFRAAAEVFGPGVLAIVMTGMGTDGLQGCQAVRESGGRIFVQDEATSVIWGMPGAVAKADLADEILPLDQIAQAIHRSIFPPAAKSPATPLRHLTGPRS